MNEKRRPAGMLPTPTAGHQQHAAPDKPTHPQSSIAVTELAAQLQRRLDASRRLPPLGDGHRDPLSALARRHRRRVPRTVLSLSTSLAVLRRAWVVAHPADREVLQAIADYLREVAA